METTCANSGCALPGTNQCSACKTTLYCGRICQTADWIHHNEECPGHLRKMGMTNLEKAKAFYDANNWSQSLRYADLAATKLKRLKDRPVEDLDDALSCKFGALTLMDRHKEALECAKELYCLYPTNHTHPPAILASFAVIESCGHNREFFDAALYARTVWETITGRGESHIPDNKREEFTARGALELARALQRLAAHGDMPAEEQKETGVEAIMLARRALEINTQLYGADERVAISMGVLGDVLNYFNDVDDDEVTRLYKEAIAIYTRIYGILFPNVALGEQNLGKVYLKIANRAHVAFDIDGFVANLEMAQSHYREAARIYRAINHMEDANDAEQEAVKVEEWLRRAAAIRATATSEEAESLS